MKSSMHDQGLYIHILYSDPMEISELQRALFSILEVLSNEF